MTKANERPVRTAMTRGAFCRCPNCGTGKLFDGYLTVKEQCQNCDEDLGVYRTADAPAFFTMTIVGLLFMPIVAWTFVVFRPDPLTLALILCTSMTALTLAVLRLVKGATVGFFWAQKEVDRGA